MYDYEILFMQEPPQGADWIRLSNQQKLGQNLLVALKELGRDGWEMVSGVDVARSPRAEIFLKKKIG